MTENKKIVFVGSCGVGKTHFVCRLVGKTYFSYVPTIGAEAYTYENYNIWDMSGTEKMGGMRDAFYICRDSFVVFCSLNSLESIQTLPFWISQCGSTSLSKNGEVVPFTIVVNTQNETLENLNALQEFKNANPTYKFVHMNVDTCPIEEVKAVMASLFE